MKELTQEKIRELLHYDPSTGAFNWRSTRPGLAKKGTQAGNVMSHGYRRISVGGRRYLAHRLAWFYVNGVWPACQLDHINGDVSDNRIENLREATHAQNMLNRKRRSDSSSGFKGVFWKPAVGKYQVFISVDGKRRSLGYFKTAEEGHAAYCRAAEKLHGEFARVA